MTGAQETNFLTVVDSIFEISDSILSLVCLGLFLIAVVILAFLMARHPGRRLSILWGFSQGLVEPALAWGIFIVLMWRAFAAHERFLGVLFPWPVATALAIGGLYLTVRLRRRGRISSEKMCRYLFYTFGFWGFYASPSDWQPGAWLGIVITCLLIAGAVYLADEDTYSSGGLDQQPRDRTAKAGRKPGA